MKLTREKLKNLVKEELKFVLKENQLGQVDTNDNLRCPECDGKGSHTQSNDLGHGTIDNTSTTTTCPYCKGKKIINVRDKFNELLLNKNLEDIKNYVISKNAGGKDYSNYLMKQLKLLYPKYYTGLSAEKALLELIADNQEQDEAEQAAAARQKNYIF